jgi:hypothetical protein
MHILYRPYPIEGTLIKIHKDPSIHNSNDTEYRDDRSDKAIDRQVTSEKIGPKFKEIDS